MTFIITPGELQYEHGLILSGQSYKVFCATTGSLTTASTITQWEAAELSATGGYSAVTGTIAAGSLNATTGRWESPVITGQFGPATSAGFQFDAMIIKIGTSRTKPYAVRLFPSPVVLVSGQTRGFQFTLGIKP